MAQPLQNITIAAPAFKGLNTQDSPLSGDVQYAAVVDNMVIDTYGRIGSRKGLEALTVSNTPLNGASPVVIHEYEDAAGTTEVLTIADNKVFKGTTTLTNITPAGYTITNENYAVTNFNDKVFLFNKNIQPLVYDTANGLVEMVAFSGTAPRGDIAIGGFGRLWVSGVAATPNTVYWSDLLIGEGWSSGSSGSVDLDKVWPDGSDKVTALAMWNGFLIIFGYNSIVLYQGAEDPASMVLSDTINGVGCVARDTIQVTGTDLLFLSARGLMSLGRIIQEKSNPINDVSKNVRDDVLYFWKQELLPVRSAYSAVGSFYLLSFPTNNLIYCFDTRGLLENGAYRATTWNSTNHACFCRRQDDSLLIGNELGINKYNGYSDNGQPYTIRYASNPLSFGDPSKVKFAKKITPTLITTGNSQVTVKWAYDVTNDFKKQLFNITNKKASYFNQSLFYSTQATTDDYGGFSDGASEVTIKRINATGSGNLLTIGLDSTVNGDSVSIQEFNIQATIGRIY